MLLAGKVLLFDTNVDAGGFTRTLQALTETDEIRCKLNDSR